MKNEQTTIISLAKKTTKKNDRQNKQSINLGKKLIGLKKIILPPFCNFYKSEEMRWIVDCGRITRNDARFFMGKILESQGWEFCHRALIQAAWIKDNIITHVVEGESLYGDESPSYPFSLSQYKLYEPRDFYCEK